MATNDRLAPSAIPGWLRTDSLCFLLLLALLSVGVAHAWTVWGLPTFNSDHLGCDACHHAVLIHCQSLPDPVERAWLVDILEGTAEAAHWLAARWMPLLDDDPYKAMRAVSAASILLLLACQFALFRRVLPAGPALLTVLAWQLLCYLTNVGNTQYYCVAYFFTQGVGMTFVWFALLLTTWPAALPWQRGALTLAGAACAGLAYLCHIVPGVAILGGLGLYFLMCYARARSAAGLARMALIGTVGLAVILGTAQLVFLAKVRGDGGIAPLKNWAFLLSWAPTLLLALYLPGRRWWLGKQQRLPVEDLLEVLTCVLCVAGLLQGYCAIEVLQGKSPWYSTAKFFYVLFPASTMIWVLAVVRWLQRTERLALLLSHRLLTGWSAQAVGAALVAFLLVLNGQSYVRNELVVKKNEKVNEDVGPERHPVRVARRLAEEARREGVVDPRWRSDLLYFDPALPESSFFVNVVGLRRNWGDGFQVNWELRDWRADQPLPAGLQKVYFTRLVLPPSVSALSQPGPGRHGVVAHHP